MNNGGTIAVGLTVLAVLIRIAVGIGKEKERGEELLRKLLRLSRFVCLP